MQSVKTGNKKILAFQNGNFILCENGNETIVDLKAAVALRSYATTNAGNVINRAFIKHYLIEDFSLPQFLDSHQVEGVKWILTRSRSYLAHAPGAGKTLEAIVAGVYSRGPGQVVFIVPPQLTVSWEREINKWLEQIQQTFWPLVSIIPRSNRQEFAGWNADFIICPDSMLTKPWVLKRLIEMRKKLVAVDEASRFKEESAERTRALFGGQLKTMRSPGLLKARHVVLMDGSPMPNRPIELWAPTFAMAPQAIDFQSKQDFGFRYCGATIDKFGHWEFKHSSREPELKEKLQKEFMHVVSEDQLNHPERKRSILFMDHDVRSPHHKKWEKENLSKIKLSEISEGANQGTIATFRQDLGVRKIPWVASYVKDRLISKNEKILLFAWHRTVCQTLQALLHIDSRLVIGDTPIKEREKAFDEFQKGKIKLIVGNIAAMGRGHNLQNADRVIFAEYSWTDELNKQCEKRASRKGSTKSFVRCEYIVCPNSMDEIILQSVFRKAESVKKVIG